MEITIKGDAKEIAALVAALQGRQVIGELERYQKVNPATQI